MESLSTESVIALLTGGVITGLSWWVTRLYSTVDDLQDVQIKLETRLSVAESKIQGIQHVLEKMEHKLDQIYLILQRTEGIE